MRKPLSTKKIVTPRPPGTTLPRPLCEKNTNATEIARIPSSEGIGPLGAGEPLRICEAICSPTARTGIVAGATLRILCDNTRKTAEFQHNSLTAHDARRARDRTMLGGPGARSSIAHDQ